MDINSLVLAEWFGCCTPRQAEIKVLSLVGKLSSLRLHPVLSPKREALAAPRLPRMMERKSKKVR